MAISWKENAMDGETYTDKQGLICPYCRCGGNLKTTSEITADESGAYQDVRCGDCGCEYRDIYLLVDYEELYIPETLPKENKNE